MNPQMFLKNILKDVLTDLGASWPERALIEPPREKRFGDLATNVAMLLAKDLKKNPREIAQSIRQRIEEKSIEEIEKIEVAGPGFLNFSFSPSLWQGILQEVLNKGKDFGKSDMGRRKKILVEYVSANPTGPLHVGHGRGAAVGDSLSRILRFAGYSVDTEYYVNDAGRQIRLLGKSIFIRYKNLFGIEESLCDDCYKGEYIIEIAKDLKEKYGDELLTTEENKAIYICASFGKDVILKGIKEDLAAFGAQHQIWFSEKSLIESKAIDSTFAFLKEKGFLYEKDGALWFKSSALGDTKDRVVKKSTGDLTYFASDIAYHRDKLIRGYDILIDIWGADHHGYIPRMKAAIEALGYEKDTLQVILIQLVNLLREGKQVSMSTRAGEFVTLKDVMDEVGVDATRFTFLSRKSDSHLDFDLELAKKKSMENPVFYVQYAHARICSVFSKAKEKGIDLSLPSSSVISLLREEEEIDLLKKLGGFPEVVSTCARLLSPHLITYYLIELAGGLHQYYNKHSILGAPSKELTMARMYLLKGIRQVIASGLNLLGVSAPERM